MGCKIQLGYIQEIVKQYNNIIDHNKELVKYRSIIDVNEITII